jgi:hypothetical protein
VAQKPLSPNPVSALKIQLDVGVSTLAFNHVILCHRQFSRNRLLGLETVNFYVIQQRLSSKDSLIQDRAPDRSVRHKSHPILRAFCRSGKSKCAMNAQEVEMVNASHGIPNASARSDRDSKRGCCWEDRSELTQNPKKDGPTAPAQAFLGPEPSIQLSTSASHSAASR